MKREADAYIPLSRYDPRANLSDEELRAKHPEVVIYWNGERHVGDPKREWFQFTGKGSGRVKCTSPQAGEKCKEFAAKYDQLKQEAARIVSQGGG